MWYSLFLSGKILGWYYCQSKLIHYFPSFQRKRATKERNTKILCIMTYKEFTSEGVLIDCDIFSKSLILQSALMFSSSRKQMHLLLVQTSLISSTLTSTKTTKTTRRVLEFIITLYNLKKMLWKKKTKTFWNQRGQ